MNENFMTQTLFLGKTATGIQGCSGTQERFGYLVVRKIVAHTGDRIPVIQSATSNFTD
jgi:hypothetical protein